MSNTEQVKTENLTYDEIKKAAKLVDKTVYFDLDAFAASAGFTPPLREDGTIDYEEIENCLEYIQKHGVVFNDNFLAVISKHFGGAIKERST